LILRCRSCHGTVWVQTEQATAKSTPATCRDCGQRYRLEASAGLRAAGHKLHEEARKLAQKESIDLPGAYSVLLGVMPIDEVRELAQPLAGAAPPAEVRGAPDKLQELSYDPAFGEAVAAGLLTPRQAMERGKREAYAASLTQRHGLPLEQALAVADNRVPLLQALRQHEGAKKETVKVRVRTGLPEPVKWIGVAAMPLLIAALVLANWDGPSGTTTIVTRPVNDGAVLTDSAGRLVQVSGKNPRSVLRIFCASAVADRPYRAVDLVASPHQGVSARLGLMRDPANPEALLAITIREDERAGMWVAGNGRTPLIPDQAPDGVEAALRANGAEKP
jgi:hypothetical protein